MLSPVGPELLEKVVHGIERFQIRATAKRPAVAGLLDEPGSLEHLEVLRDSGKREIMRLGELTHRAFLLREPAQKRSPRGIGQSLKNEV